MNKNVERYAVTFFIQRLNKKLYLMRIEDRKVAFTEKIEHAQIMDSEKDAIHTAEFLCSAYVDLLRYEDLNGNVSTLPFNVKYELPENLNVNRITIAEIGKPSQLDREMLKYILDREGY